LTRNQNEATKIVKSFYLQYPIYKWVTFKELRGLPKKQFAEELAKSCLAVWVDDQAGFGTFPLEAFECNTPVIGKIPNMVPEWMESVDGDGNPVINNNGVWTNTTLNLPELIATYMKLWFEDSIPSDLLESVKQSQGKYTSQRQKDELSKVYQTLTSNRVLELTNLINKLEEQLTEITEKETSNQ
jgi:glycosyltransferase involved in cell wall biosynthesis